MSNDAPYIQRDLIDHADLDSVDWSHAWSREDALEEALPEASEQSFKRSGGYQGGYALVVRFDDCLWVETGSYGSCGGCDAFLAHKRQEMERLLRDAYCFETVQDLAQWALESEALEMSYGSARKQLHEALDEFGVSFDEQDGGDDR